MRAVNLVPRKGRMDDGVKAKLLIDANTLVCSSSKKQICGIPFRSITGLSHDPQTRNRAAVYGDSGGGGSAADLLILAALTPFHARWEYVTIEWRDNGVPRKTMLRFRSADFSSFEREVTTRTSLRFEDAAKQREATIQQIERRKSEVLPVHLDRGTFIRNEPVHGGLYQILIIEREPGSGDLYLFAGKQVDPKKPAWVVPVSITASAENPVHPEPDYSPRKRWKNLEAIRLPARTVRVMP